ncbi:MAG: RecX family transcriptional regulator [Trueperaceae bacterium]|nr:RecX family transcriptional regulator [Trueperaceae bacterium]
MSRGRALRAPTPLDPERAWDYALELLARRAMSAAEVRERLRRRSLPEPDADAVVAKLERLGLLNDRAFAEAYVRSRARERGCRALRRELQHKGVAEDVAEGALAPHDDADQAVAARALLRKHAWRFAAADDDPAAVRAARARAYGLLARRGFPPDAAQAAVEAALGAADPD